MLYLLYSDDNSLIFFKVNWNKQEFDEVNRVLSIVTEQLSAVAYAVRK